MSWQSCPDPALGDMDGTDSIETVIVPRIRDLGGFEVRRALPSRTRQMVGPFIFFARSIAHTSTISESLRASVSSVSR
jgi:redox-sensitive bicupin YhaK (pirin superfamily)